MKFWQLISVCRDMGALESTLKNAQPSKYYQWLRDLDEICKLQDRTKLDAMLPGDLVSKALSASPGMVYFCEADRTLRSYSFAKNEQKMSYVEAWRNFGSTALEEALEKGSFRVL